MAKIQICIKRLGRMFTVEINGREAHINFESAHMIPESDKCRHLHGHSYFVNARITGDSGKSMLVDFTELKKRLREIASTMDHRMLIPAKDHRFRTEGESITAEIDGRSYVFAREDCFMLDAEACTAELIAMHIHRELTESAGEFKVAVGVEEGLGSVAWYEP